MSETTNESSWVDKNKTDEQKRLKQIATKLGMKVYGLVHVLSMLRPGDLQQSDEKVEEFFGPVGELFAEAMELQKEYAERRKLTDPKFGK